MIEKVEILKIKKMQRKEKKKKKKKQKTKRDLPGKTNETMYNSEKRGKRKLQSQSQD